MVTGAPRGLRSGTRPRRGSLRPDLGRRGEVGAHSSHRRRRRGCCCFATLAAILTQPLSLPPAPAAAAKAAPAPAPPPSGRLEDRLPPLAERRSYLGRASWVARSPVPSCLDSAWRRRSPQPDTGPGSTVPDPDQRAAIAHGLGRPPRAGRLPRSRGLSGAWEREAREAEPRALRPLRGAAGRRACSSPGCGEGSRSPHAGSWRGAHRPTQDTSHRDFTEVRAMPICP